MENFWLYIGLAFAGHAFHLLKQYIENVKRKQEFKANILIASEAMNIIAIFLLTYMAINAPSDWLVMTPIMAIMIGGFGSSMLSAIINTRQPKELNASSSDNNDDVGGGGVGTPK